MLRFVELRLGEGWREEPNAPDPQVSVAASSVNVRFRCFKPIPVNATRPRGILAAFGRSSRKAPWFDEAWGVLTFARCSRWRWDATNEHEWFKEDGNGRYSGIASEWGKFYELIGDDPIRDAVPWEQLAADCAAPRHFLFYFRDETLEFLADDWSFSLDRDA
ncbi:MAG: hypothetical protein KF914_14510 [Rhizobiaceae bacterium]|nr:hypothetical protein [Rhizobiaceae bacterium]